MFSKEIFLKSFSLLLGQTSYTVTSSCILTSRHGHVLSFISIYVLLEPAPYLSFCAFRYNLYASTQYINVTSAN